MENSKKCKLNLNLIQNIYIVAFVTYLLLSRCVLFVNIISQRVNSILYMLFAIAGAMLVATIVFVENKKLINKWTLILFSFCVVCVISSLLNFDYGFTNNVKTLVWLAIQFFILFVAGYTCKQGWNTSIFRKIGQISSFVWFGGVLISLVQFLFQIKYRAPFSEFRRRQGFVDSRLFGIFSDPNYAAVTSLVVIVFCYFLYRGCTDKKARKYYLVNIAVQILYVILSGSRTAMVEGVLLAFALAYFEERKKRYAKGERQVKRKALGRGLITALVSILLIVVIPLPMKGLATAGLELRKLVFQDEDLDKEIDMERDDVSQDNISNSRMDIWTSALEVSKEARIFGLSPRNMISYAKANYPDSFIAETGYETHNGYLAVFVGSGIVGFAVMVLFVILILRSVILYIQRMRRTQYHDEVFIAFLILAIIAISTVALQDIFFVNTYSAAIFWLFLGYFLNFIGAKGKGEDEKSKSDCSGL